MTDIPLKEYIQIQITGIEREINRLNASHVDKTRYDQLRLQVASLSEGIQELEQRFNALDERLEVLETHDSIGLWAFRLIVGVATALLIGWLSGLIG